MVEKATNDDIAKLNDRIKELEDELRKQRASDKDDGSASRFADHLSDARDSEFDMITRVVRGLTLATAEATKLTASTLSNFADDVISRNSKRDDGDRTVRNLAWRLPEDILGGLSRAIDDLGRVPSKAATRYSRAYDEGTKSTSSR